MIDHRKTFYSENIVYKKIGGHSSPADFWCERQDLNLHGFPQDSKSCASAGFAISAKNKTPYIGVKKEKHNIQGFLVGTTELESVTSCMSSKRSNQLSYAPAEKTTQ